MLFFFRSYLGPVAFELIAFVGVGGEVLLRILLQCRPVFDCSWFFKSVVRRFVGENLTELFKKKLLLSFKLEDFIENI